MKTKQARRERVPAYKKIGDAIRKRIADGRLRPGDAIDSERELAKTHGVSLMTARQALVDLDREGLVHRKSGSGTFVSPPRIHFNRLTSFSEQMQSRGFTPHSRLLKMGMTEATGDVAANLGLPEESPLVRVQRLRLGNDEPFAVETCYLDGQIYGGLLSEPLDRRSLFQVLSEEYRVQLAHADEEADATQADGRVAELLQVAPGSPLLRIRQLLFSREAQPITYSIALYRSDRHSLMIRRFR